MMTHALPPDSPAEKPLTVLPALCGIYIRFEEDASWHATCPNCRALLDHYATLEP